MNGSVPQVASASNGGAWCARITTGFTKERHPQTTAFVTIFSDPASAEFSHTTARITHCSKIAKSSETRGN